MPEQKILSDKKILIGGYSEDMRSADLLRHFLKEEGYGRVDIAFNINETLDKISSQRYQLLLLDMTLPGTDNILALQRIKKLDDKITVIVITDSSNIKVAEEAIKMGAYDYITKPFDLDYLKLLVLTKVFVDTT